MNNTKIIGGVLVVVVAIGAFFYFKKADAPSTAVPLPAPAEEKSVAKSLRDLIAGGQSQKCTFTNVVDNSTSEGVVYISGKKMRGDFSSKITATGKVVATHMITDEKEMRVWTDGESMGFLMDTAAQPQKDTAGQKGSQSESPVNLDDKNVDYKCESWSVDPSFFVPPADVMFHSMADMMNMGGAGTSGSDAGMGPGMEAGGSVDMKTMQCQMCAQAGDAKAVAQCKATLGCE